jgi:hypothetical protein
MENTEKLATTKDGRIIHPDTCIDGFRSAYVHCDYNNRNHTRLNCR